MNLPAFIFHGIVRVVHGLNPITVTKRPGERRHTLDVTRLTRFETRFFLSCMSDLISACVDSGPHLHIWLLDRAITESFARAMEGRAAKLRHSYDHHGGLSYSPSALCSCFKVTLRAPDSAIKSTELITPEDNARVTKMMIGAPVEDRRFHAENARTGVTVDELYIAMLDVGTDVLERHPRIMYAPEDASSSKLAGQEHAGDELLTWESATPFETFAEDLHRRGKYEINKKWKKSTAARRNQESVSSSQSKLLLLDPVSEYRGTGSLIRNEEEIQGRLEEIEKEIKSLQQELGLAITDHEVDALGDVDQEMILEGPRCVSNTPGKVSSNEACTDSTSAGAALSDTHFSAKDTSLSIPPQGAMDVVNQTHDMNNEPDMSDEFRKEIEDAAMQMAVTNSEFFVVEATNRHGELWLI